MDGELSSITERHEEHTTSAEPKKRKKPSTPALVRQLSRSFAPLNWGSATERIDFDQAGSFLEVKHAEDIAQMCELGLLKPLGDVENQEMDCAEVLRFLKAHGRGWMLGRLEAQISRLEGELTASTTRAKPRKKHVDPHVGLVESLRELAAPDRELAAAASELERQLSEYERSLFVRPGKPTTPCTGPLPSDLQQGKAVAR